MSLERALLHSLVKSPLLIQDLPEAISFDRSFFEIPAHFPELNLQQKLGHLYEDALAFLLRHSPKIELLEQSLQIQIDRHQTVGELDFLVLHRESQEIIHLELATKFYLALSTEEGLLLPGPDARDNYHKKLARLREHQLKLLQKHRQHLPDNYQKTQIETQQLIYGCLFDNVHATEMAQPEFLNPHCRRGRWIHLHDCESFFPKDTTFQHIPKALWPVSLELLEDYPLEEWHPPSSLERCQMVKVNEELTPYFITPYHYPGA